MREYFKYGLDGLDSVEDSFEYFFLNDEQLKTLWEENQVAIIEDWIKSSPCSRPHGFWEFDYPSRKEHESEVEYLSKHKLLTKEEEKYLSRYSGLKEGMKSNED